MWCDAWNDGVPQGPVQAGLVDGDLGAARGVCPTTSVGLTAGGSAIVETENLYGRIRAGGTLTGSYKLADNAELYASIEAVRLDMIITAISVTGLGPGYTDVGGSWRFSDGPKHALALHGTFVLPTAFTIDKHSFPLGIDLGLDAVYAPKDTLLLHGSVVPNFGVALGGGPAYPAFGVNLDLGAEWKPWKRFGFVLDGISAFGRTDVLDYAGVGVGFRGGIGDHFGLSLEARMPLVGRARELASADLRGVWRF